MVMSHAASRESMIPRWRLGNNLQAGSRYPIEKRCDNDSIPGEWD